MNSVNGHADLPAWITGNNGDDANGVDSITPLANTHGDRRKVGGVDTVEFNFWCRMEEQKHTSLMHALDEARKLARLNNRPVEFAFHGAAPEYRSRIGTVHPRGSGSGAGYKFIIDFDGVRVLVNSKNNPTRNSNVRVIFMGGAMIHRSWNIGDALAHAEELLSYFQFSIDKHSIARLDLFADLVGVCASKFARLAERGRVVRRARDIGKFNSCDHEPVMSVIEKHYADGKEAVLRAVAEKFDAGLEVAKIAARVAIQGGEMDIADYGAGEKGRGVQIGKGQAVCRVYDKQFQLDRMHPERVETMLELWEAAPEDPVTRVEFQLRGQFLRSWSLKTVADFEKHKTRLVEYLTESWVVFVTKYDKHNKDRRVVHPLWRRVRAVFRSILRDGKRRLKRPVIVPDENGTKRLLKQAVGLLRTASGRAFGAIEAVGDYRTGIHQLIEEAVSLKDGWDGEYVGHLHVWSSYVNRIGGRGEITYPFEQWSQRPELVDVVGPFGIQSMAGVPDLPLKQRTLLNAN